jgi:hypothetical protein
VLGISNLDISTIRQSVNGINKPKRGYCFTMWQTSFGRMESFIYLYIWNQKCSTLFVPYCTTGSRIFSVLDVQYVFFSHCTLCKGSNSLVFEIRNVPFNIQFYITIILLDYPYSDYFFSPKSGKIIYLCENQKSCDFRFLLFLLNKRNVLEKSTVYSFNPVTCYWSTWTKPGGIIYMCVRDIEFNEIRNVPFNIQFYIAIILLDFP